MMEERGRERGKEGCLSRQVHDASAAVKGQRNSNKHSSGGDGRP